AHVADAVFLEAEVARQPHRVDLIALEVQRVRQGDADLVPAEETDGGLGFGGRLVVDDVHRLLRRAAGEHDVRVGLIIEEDAEAETLVLGDGRPLDGHEVPWPYRGLEQLDVERRVPRRRRLRARGRGDQLGGEKG